MRPLVVFCCFCLLLFVGVEAIPTSSKVSKDDLMRNIIHFLQQQQQAMMEDKRSLDLGLHRDYSARALGLGMLARQLVDSQYGAGK
uniref:Uncharacterized protein n=1 Tax=Plectus sambesii TaxID=2011161 RepID=A0A914VPW5_9BILA